MTLHETWVAAKKQAWKEFKEAQKNYLKAQDKKINETNDAKAKKKALDMVLGEAGLDKGESLDDYLKFADGFGKQLDTLEKAIENNIKLKAKYKFEDKSIDNLLQNKDVAKQFLLFAQRSHIGTEVSFYLQGYKKPPDVVLDQYVNDQSADAFDFSADEKLQRDWQAAAGDPATLAREGKSLVERLRVHVKAELERDKVTLFKKDAAAMKNLGIVAPVPLQALAREVMETAVKYDGEIQTAVNKWSRLKPQFWRPLDDALEEIKLFAENQLPKRN